MRDANGRTMTGICPKCGLEITPKEPAECPICHWEMDADEGCARTACVESEHG